MSNINFIDYVKICCRSGKGGAGAVHFHRAMYVPNGGPDGGDGGRGGHIIVRGNAQMWTLLPLRYKKHVIAGNGENGGGNRRSGSFGKDVYLEVPIGTIARDVETDQILFEILEDGEEIILLDGGQGGKGNDFFKSSTNQAPRYSQPGGDGKEEWKILELKILADVGLVGFPNAGKSTLLASISAAKPKIGAYPFTTLKPNLGIVGYRDNRSFVMADIPGIIQDAHQGKGLGLRFLRHIERNSCLLFIIPADTNDIKMEYSILKKELELYNPELLDKKMILGISKSDLIDEELEQMITSLLPTDIPYIFFSAVTQHGLIELKDLIWDALA